MSDYLTKLNSAFDDFESSHEDVINSFGDDPAFCDAENSLKWEKRICMLFKGSNFIL